MKKPRIVALGVIYRESENQREFLVQCVDNEAFYRFPGGSIELGETAAEAIVRELQEEYDLTVSVGPLWIVNENFFVHRHQPEHIINLLHLCALKDTNPFSELRHKEYDDVKLVWRSQTAFFNKPLYPQGIRDHLNASTEQIIHLISHQTTK